MVEEGGAALSGEGEVVVISMVPSKSCLLFECVQIYIYGAWLLFFSILVLEVVVISMALGLQHLNSNTPVSHRYSSVH